MPLSLRESIAKTRPLPRTDAVLMGRAELLAPGDRDLLEAVLIRGQPAAALGRIMGVPGARVRKRIRRLCHRLTSAEFLDAARSLNYLARADAKLAKLHFCQGLSQRSLREAMGLSRHALQRRLDGVQAQIATVKRLRLARQKAGHR